MTQNAPKLPKYDPKWPKLVQHGPRITQKDPKWPKYDPKWTKITPNGPNMTPGFTHFFRKFFYWKSGSANFFTFRMYESIIKKQSNASSAPVLVNIDICNGTKKCLLQHWVPTQKKTTKLMRDYLLAGSSPWKVGSSCSKMSAALRLFPGASKDSLIWDSNGFPQITRLSWSQTSYKSNQLKLLEDIVQMKFFLEFEYQIVCFSLKVLKRYPFTFTGH